MQSCYPPSLTSLQRWLLVFLGIVPMTPFGPHFYVAQLLCFTTVDVEGCACGKGTQGQSDVTPHIKSMSEGKATVKRDVHSWWWRFQLPSHNLCFPMCVKEQMKDWWFSTIITRTTTQLKRHSFYWITTLLNGTGCETTSKYITKEWGCQHSFLLLQAPWTIKNFPDRQSTNINSYLSHCISVLGRATSVTPRPVYIHMEKAQEFWKDHSQTRHN